MTARSDDDLHAVNARLRARVAELQGQIAELETECLVLRDGDSARAAAAAEQRSHQQYRLRNPARRAAS